MHNTEISTEGKILTIKIDISDEAVAAAPLSKTGKTRLLASSSGSVAVSCQVPGLQVAVNVMIPPGRDDRS